MPPLDALRLDPLSPLRALPAIGGTARQPAYQLTPEEEQSLLSSIGGGLLSGVGWLGETLGKGGAAVRGVASGLGGGPWGGGLWNLLPFSDTLGITKSEEKVSGQQLNEQLGIDTGEPISNFIAGVGTDILTDPLSWVGGLAGSGLSKAGKAAKKAGLWEKGTKLPGLGRVASKQQGSITKLLELLPETERVAKEANLAKVFGKMGKSADEIAALREAPLGGLLNLGFFGAPWATVGTGATAQKIGSGIDKTLGALGSTLPARLAKAAFYPSVGGAVGAEAQKINSAAYFARKGVKAQVAVELGKWGDEVQPLFQEFRTIFKPTLDKLGANAPDLTDTIAGEVFDTLVRHSGEIRSGTKAIEDILPGVAGALPDQARLANLATGLETKTAELHALFNKVHQASADLGLKSEYMPEEIISHFFRTGQPKDEAARRLAKLLPTSAGSDKARKLVTAEIPTEIVNRMAHDPKLHHKVVDPKYVMDKYGEWLQGYNKVEGDKVVRATAQEQAEAIAKHFVGTPKTAVYPAEFLADQSRYYRGELLKQKSAQAIHTTFADNLSSEVSPLADTVGLADAYKAIGMKPEESITHLSGLTKTPVAKLANMAVPAKWVEAAKGLLAPQNSTELGSAFGKWYDKILGVIKGHFTMPFPSFHSRNFQQMAGAMLMNGTVEGVADAPKWAAAVGRSMPKGANWKNEELLKLADRYGLFGTIGRDDMPLTAAAVPKSTWGTGQAARSAPPTPLAFGTTLKEAAAQTASTSSVIPFFDKVPLSKAARTASDFLVKTGGKVHTGIENSLRLAAFDYLTNAKGWSPEAAVQKVMETFFDYSKAAKTPFERSVMQRLVPFYTFTSRMAPLLFNTILERPGGAMASTIKATGRGVAGPGRLLPPHVAQSLAIPMGAGPSGEDRYFTTSGMGYEDVAGFLGGGFKGAGLEALSRTSPLLKGPLEWITGQSFFQRGPGGGRQLQDMDPALGRTIANLAGERKPMNMGQLPETIIANSPASRYISTARTATDLRKEWWAKALNLLTPSKVSDVTEAATDAMAREGATQLLRKMPGTAAFERIAMPKDELAQQTPEVQQQYKEYQALLTKLSKKSKERHRQRDLQFLLP